MNTPKTTGIVFRMRQIFHVALRNVRERFYAYRFYNSSRLVTACDITCGVKFLGRRGTGLPHPVGIVIGDKVEIGRGCRIYQNVTIGAKSDGEAALGIYPRIGNNVKIFAGAVLVGNISVGDDAIIGAGAIVTRDVRAGAIVAGNPAREIR